MVNKTLSRTVASWSSCPQESEHDDELDFTEAPVSRAFPWGGRVEAFDRIRGFQTLLQTPFSPPKSNTWPKLSQSGPNFA